MSNLIIIEHRQAGLNELKYLTSKHKIKAYDQVLIVEGIESALEIIENDNDIRHSEVDILVYYGYCYKEKVDEMLERFMKIEFSFQPKIYVYTDLDIHELPEIVFSNKVEYLFFTYDIDEKFLFKAISCLQSRMNWVKLEPKVSSFEEYTQLAISKIDGNISMIGARYLIEICKLTYNKRYSFPLQIKKLYKEVEDICMADSVAIEGSIRNLIKKGNSKDNLKSFFEFVDMDSNLTKVTNQSIITAIILGYQNSDFNSSKKIIY